MTAHELIDRADIVDIWRALGGGPLRHGRGAAFWRDGDGLNVSLDDAKGAWYDHARSAGGGVLRLIEVAQGCDRPAALRWLANHHNVDLDGRRPLTKAEKRTYARRRGHAEKKARKLTAWRRDRLRALRDDRNRLYVSENGTCAIARTLLATGDGTEEQWAAIWACVHDDLRADEIAPKSSASSRCCRRKWRPKWKRPHEHDPLAGPGRGL